MTLILTLALTLNPNPNPNPNPNLLQEDMRGLLTRLLKKRRCVETQSHLRNLRLLEATLNPNPNRGTNPNLNLNCNGDASRPNHTFGI